jgi:hypothetical protein
MLFENPFLKILGRRERGWRESCKHSVGFSKTLAALISTQHTY